MIITIKWYINCTYTTMLSNRMKHIQKHLSGLLSWKQFTFINYINDLLRMLNFCHITPPMKTSKLCIIYQTKPHKSFKKWKTVGFKYTKHSKLLTYGTNYPQPKRYTCVTRVVNHTRVGFLDSTRVYMHMQYLYTHKCFYTCVPLYGNCI